VFGVWCLVCLVTGCMNCGIWIHLVHYDVML